jgi:hypothetical protein
MMKPRRLIWSNGNAGFKNALIGIGNRPDDRMVRM